MRPTTSHTPSRDATPSGPHNATTAAAAPVLTQRERLLAAAIAEHLADLLHHRPPVRLVDAATLAAALGVSRDFVYAHANELGGERIGSGPRGRLRFDLDKALAACTPSPVSKEFSQPIVPTAKRRRRTATSGAARLLPIRGRTPGLQIVQGRS
jgi:hypothetical protein